MIRKRFIAAGLAITVVAACKPAPPPDVLKAQHEALDKARALGAQMQQQEQERMKSAEDAQK